MLAANPAVMAKLMKGSAGRFSFRDYAAIKTKADEFIDKGSRLPLLYTALDFARVPPELRPVILGRWKNAGGPPLRKYAPYTAFCLSVDVFRELAMGSGHMSWEKSSNYVDLAYLYYLPFCQVFISTDKIHRHTVPLFMDAARQAFVWGPDLRAELALLVAEYIAAPDIEEVGLLGVSGRKMFDADSFIGRLYRRFHPGKIMGDRDVSKSLSPEAEAKLVAEMKKRMEGVSPPPGTDLSQEDHTVGIKRMVSARKGKFAVLPKHVVEAEKKKMDAA
jgi:hypothetical protein